ncbi:MAG TPA: hypothetical protein VHO48_09770 [Anaerolineaceae bacterium]|nr:hypothetical protein [Anaerolineaceae bacterium]
MTNRATAFLAVLLILLVTAPYLYAATQGGEETVFGGFLFNPRDGNSYLAKMQQGREGSWTFKLPFTAEPGQGVFLFVFYLALGHLGRFTGLPLIWVYHLARVLATAALVFALRDFFRHLFPDMPRPARQAMLLTIFTSGLGWIVSLAGGLTSDLWVAEGYAFLSAYANPHFPLGLALMLWLFTRLDGASTWRNLLGLFVLGLLLALVMPFGLAVTAAVAGVYFLWNAVGTRQFRPLLYLAAFSGGGALLLYQYPTTLAHPALAVWNMQNFTPSPPFWDALLSFSPALMMGLVALPAFWRQRGDANVRWLLSWFLAGLVLIYAPFNLQRRFMLGYSIPCAAMAAWGIHLLEDRMPGRRWPFLALFILALPSNLIVLASGFYGASTRDPLLYLSHDEAAALEWIQTSTPRDALILAGEEMGMYIPARTGRRVIYGHPFETVNAADELANVERFFSGELSRQEADAFLRDREVDFVLVSAREQGVDRAERILGLPVVFQSGPVALYAVEPER